MGIARKKRQPSAYRRIWEIMEESEKRHAQWQAEHKARHDQWEADFEAEKAENKARQAEWEKRQKDLDTKFGHLTNRLGEWAESELVPMLPEKFRVFGYTFSQINRNVYFNDKAHDIAVEMDGFLEDGDCCVAVEIKVKPQSDHIAIFIRRLERIRRFMDIRQDTRRLYGAIGGTVTADSEVRDMILGRGFYLIEPSGEDVVVTPPPSAPIPY